MDTRSARLEEAYPSENQLLTEMANPVLPQKHFHPAFSPEEGIHTSMYLQPGS